MQFQDGILLRFYVFVFSLVFFVLRQFPVFVPLQEDNDREKRIKTKQCAIKHVGKCLALSSNRGETVVRDYYDILDAQPADSIDTIAKCYRIQLKKNHPDINKAAGALEKTILINEAYEVLSDPVKREQYNQEYFSAMETDCFKRRKKKAGLRPFFWWLAMLVFLLADMFYQLSIAKPFPISTMVFTLFLVYTAIRDRERTVVNRVCWVVGIYLLYFALQGLAVMMALRWNVKLPLAIGTIVISQFPALLLVMRRSSHFTKSVSVWS